MTAGLPLHRYAYADYVRLESESPVRHEFLDGEIYAMAGGTPEHAALAMAIGAALFQATRGGPCRVFTSDLRVRVMPTGLVTYPDVTVVCGVSERDPESPTTVTNPTVLVEVTSTGTEDYDRDVKLQHYQRVASVTAVVIASHREPRIEVWTRQGDAWVHGSAAAGERVDVRPLHCTLDVDELYTAIREPSPT